MRFKSHCLFFLLLLSVSCDSSKSTNFELLAKDKSVELKNICDDFLLENDIRDISIAKLFDINKCEAINSWSYCGGKWETWDRKAEKRIYLFSKDSVLMHENIGRKSYDKFVRFMKKFEIETISKKYDCNSCVAFETGYDGLLYSAEGNYILKEDRNYIWVRSINKNWQLYGTDWN
jgi:hypothetical protein